MKEKLTGLIAAPFTALNADGSLNLDMIERQANLLVENKVRWRVHLRHHRRGNVALNG